MTAWYSTANAAANRPVDYFETAQEYHRRHDTGSMSRESSILYKYRAKLFALVAKYTFKNLVLLLFIVHSHFIHENYEQKQRRKQRNEYLSHRYMLIMVVKNHKYVMV